VVNRLRQIAASRDLEADKLDAEKAAQAAALEAAQKPEETVVA